MTALLAEVVVLGDNCLFPRRWAQLAELASEHDSARAALLAAEKNNGSALLDDIPVPLSTDHIIVQLNQLHDLIKDGHGWS